MAIGPTLGFGRTPSGSTTVNDIFKEFYLPGVRDILNSKRILTAYVRKNTEDVAGQIIVTAINLSRNVSPKHIGERGILPDPGTQGYDRATYNTKYYYGRISFTGPASASSRNERGAFLRVMDSEIRGLARDMQHDFNKTLFGDGSGRLANYVSGTTTVTLDNPGGFTNTGLGTQYVQVGDVVGMADRNVNYADAIFLGVEEGQVITAVDYTLGTIDVATAWTSVADNDALVKVSEVTSTNVGMALGSEYRNAPFGLAALVSSGNADLHQNQATGTDFVGGINADDEANWQAFIVDNNGTPQPFSSDLLQQAMDGVDQLGDGQVQMWITTHGIRRQYLNELVANKRFVNTMALDGGFRALEYDGIPFVVDKDCTRGRIYGLDLDCLHMYMETDYEWMDADGSILHRLEDYDMYQATLYRYHEFGTDARNRLCGVFDISDT